MKNKVGEGGSKLLLVFLLIIFFYLAFFGFDIQKAIQYTFSADSGLLHAIGF